MRAALVGFLFAGMPFSFCWNNDFICTLEFVYGVNLTLEDAVTGEPITAATATLVDGDYQETMTDFGDGRYAGAGERAGTYTLLVTAPGYADRTEESIVVGPGICHVQPVQLEWELTPVE